MIKTFAPQAIFDTPEKLAFEAITPAHLLKVHACVLTDYKCAHAFLYAYKDNTDTYNAYRRETERLLLWSWHIREKSLLDLKRTDIEEYLKFCQKPLKSWIGFKRTPHYIDRSGERIPNPEWRPFVASISKAETKDGKTVSKTQYSLSSKSFKEIFGILKSLFNFLIQNEMTELNPIQQIKQQSKFLRKRQGPTKIRRLSQLQWDFVLDTTRALAADDPKHQRSLFILTALYSMYLRISELTATARWTPTMNDFSKDREGNWWFTTVGKGNKERQIAVSNSMLEALKRWREHLNLSHTPAKSDDSPLLPKERGAGPIKSVTVIRKIVQHCFDCAEAQMEKEGFIEEAVHLREATVHWLRHTGISDDVKHRPREHVRDDAGHSSSLITDLYIDVEPQARHASAKTKKLTN